MRKLFWFLSSLLVIAAILFLLTIFMNPSLTEKAKEWSAALPFVNKTADIETDYVVLEEQITHLKVEKEEREVKIQELQQSLQQYKEKNEELLIVQEKLENEIAVLQRDQQNTKKKFQEIVMTFEQMSAKSVAPILLKMDDAEALRILTSLKAERVAAILEKMPPEDGAKYTTLMTK
ncbi:MotE family protein [Sporosarcina sp. HYO08]|uniref:MotE family protein n=1 Tax=Sporosarcina sp. HYO08 TaxID=1759557 RepID=UPI00079C50B8|nr:hypothetical protein [Sporosarcina sp. HYO08]KXH79983.1 hypothetical protein AU377_10950 [Sporosarcina sp. HYO08]